MLTKEKAKLIELCRMKLIEMNFKLEDEKADFRFIETYGGVRKVSVEEYNESANSNGRRLGVFGKELAFDQFQITPEELEEELSRIGEGPIILQDFS